MADHLFAAENGELYDTRIPQWSRKAPLRKIFRKHFRDIRTPAEFKATLRAGAFAWPGGYPLFFLCSDGGCLCFSCGKKEARQIIPSIRSRSCDGWQVVACDVNYEDSELYCDHCNKPIESAYGED